MKKYKKYIVLLFFLIIIGISIGVIFNHFRISHEKIYEDKKLDLLNPTNYEVDIYVVKEEAEMQYTGSYSYVDDFLKLQDESGKHYSMTNLYEYFSDSLKDKQVYFLEEIDVQLSMKEYFELNEDAIQIFDENQKMTCIFSIADYFLSEIECETSDGYFTVSFINLE